MRYKYDESMSNKILFDCQKLKIKKLRPDYSNCTTHSKIEGLFKFQKVQIQMLPIYVYLQLINVYTCTLMNNQWILIQNKLASDYFSILLIIYTKSWDPKITKKYTKKCNHMTETLKEIKHIQFFLHTTVFGSVSSIQCITYIKIILFH